VSSYVKVALAAEIEKNYGKDLSSAEVALFDAQNPEIK